jgi:hypothetical protein
MSTERSSSQSKHPTHEDKRQKTLYFLMMNCAYQQSYAFNNDMCLFYTKTNSVLLTQYCSGDKIEKNEMGGACSAYGGE